MVHQVMLVQLLIEPGKVGGLSVELKRLGQFNMVPPGLVEIWGIICVVPPKDAVIPALFLLLLTPPDTLFKDAETDIPLVVVKCKYKTNTNTNTIQIQLLRLTSTEFPRSPAPSATARSKNKYKNII